MAVHNLGIVKPGTTLYLPFHTFDSNDPSASVTLTGLATTDIEIYKDGGTTQRASDAGYTLLDTDGIDFDTITGIHGISIDLADNTTANFYEAGSQYFVVISSVTVDAATVNFVLAQFTIGYPGAFLDTTIATLSSQTSFTLEDGSIDNDAYNGCIAYIHDLASAVQVAIGVVSDYVGSTKTVTLKADPGIFTMAAGDNISLFPPALTATTLGNTLDVTTTGAAGIDWGNVENKTTANDLSATDIQLADTATTVTNVVTANVTQLGGVAQSLTDLKDFADEGYDPATNKVQGVVLVDTCTTNTDMVAAAPTVAQIWDETKTSHVTADSFAVAVKDILVDTADIQPNYATSAAQTTAQNDLDTLTGTDGVTLATAQALYAPAKAGDSMALTAGAVDAIIDETLTSHVTADSVGVALKDILADTNELQTDDVPTTLATLATTAELNKVPKSDGSTSWNATALADTKAQVTSALDTAMPGTPTVNSVFEVVKRLKRSVDVIQEFTIDNTSFTATTTQCQVDAVDIGTLEATDTHYIGRVMIFSITGATGRNNYHATLITGYDGTNKRFTYNAVPDIPNDNDTFLVI